MLVLPQITAPAARSRATAAASGVRAGRFAYSGAPEVAGMPSTSNVSLMVIGRPCSGPARSPDLLHLVELARPRPSRGQVVANHGVDRRIHLARLRSISASSSSAALTSPLESMLQLARVQRKKCRAPASCPVASLGSVMLHWPSPGLPQALSGASATIKMKSRKARLQRQHVAHGVEARLLLRPPSAPRAARPWRTGRGRARGGRSRRFPRRK